MRFTFSLSKMCFFALSLPLVSLRRQLDEHSIVMFIKSTTLPLVSLLSRRMSVIVLRMVLRFFCFFTPDGKAFRFCARAKRSSGQGEKKIEYRRSRLNDGKREG